MKKLDVRTIGCAFPALRAVLGATLFAAALTACGGTTTPPPVLLSVDPDKSSVVAQQDHVLADGNATATLLVTALDQNGDPMSGQTVVLTASSTDALVTNPTQATDNDGKATGTIASAKPGTYTIRATVGSVALTNTVDVTFDVVVSPATKLVFERGPQKKGLIANAPIGPSIRVSFKDAQGNTVKSETRTVKLSLSFNPTSALLEGTLEKQAVQGVADFSDLTINKPGDGYEMQAMVVPNSSSIKSVKSDPFEMTVGAPTRLEVSSRPTADVGVPIQLSVTVKDAYGNTVTNYPGTVRFETSDGQMCGTMCTCCGNTNCGSDNACQTSPLPEYTFTADDKGVHDFTSQRKAVFKTAGPAQTYSAFDKLDSSVNGSASVHVRNGQPATITVTGIPVSPATVTAGSYIDFTVSVFDSYGNILKDPAFDGKVYFEVPTDSSAETPGSYTFVPPSATPPGTDEGSHAFVGGLRLKTAIPTPGHTFTAAIGGTAVLTRVSNILVVPEAQVGGLTFVTQPPFPLTARTAFGFKVAIQDNFQNTITGKTNAIAISIDQMGVVETAPAGCTPSTSAPCLMVNGHLTGTATLNAVAGVVTFTNLQVDANGKDYKLKATMVDGGTTYDQRSATFTVNDNAAPSTPSPTLTSTANSITLTWTAVGDDGTAGQAASYTIKYCSDATCANGTNIDTVGLTAPTPPTPKVAGQSETYTITGLNASTKYWVVLSVTDDAFPQALTATSALKTATTSACPTGYTGPTCAQCATGYTSGPNSTCVNLCSTGTNPCTTPPANDCNGNSMRTYASPGACTATPATAPFYTCSYTPTATDCTTTSQVCLGGACIANACAPVTCPAVAPRCQDATTLITTSSACQVLSATTYQCNNTESTRTCSGATPVCYKGPAASDVANCVAAAAPAVAGTLVITEMMLSPSGTNAKWIEIKNLTPVAISLDSVVVTETVANKTFTLPATERIEANGYYVIASAAITGVNAGTRVYVWPSAFTLGTSGHLTLVKGTTTIEDLTFGTALAGTSGVAMQVSSTFQVPKANLNTWYWCAATTAVGTGNTDLGTPGLANGDCGLTRPTDFSATATCVTHRPTAIPDAANNVWPAEVGVATKVYGRINDTGITTLSLTANDNYPFIEGDLGFGPLSTDPTAASWVWRAGAFNSAYVATDGNDEMVADLIPTVVGTYQYAWRFRLVHADGTRSPNVYCDRMGKVTATPPSSTNYAQATVRTGPATVSTQIAAVKAAADSSSLNLPVDGAVVTYMRTFAGDFPGFFVQAEATGPALWISVDPSTISLTPALAVGDKISFNVTAKRTSSGVKEVYAISNVSRISTGNSISALTTDLGAATDTVTALSTYEFRMVKATGTLMAAVTTPSGSGYVKAQFDTAGVNGATNTLQVARFPDTSVRAALGLVQGCTLTITAPLWRGMVNTSAETEFTAWSTGDLSAVNCPVPAHQVVISQVYGAGGNSGATYKTDFVELHNRGSTTMTFSGWAVQYSAATATTASWQVNALPQITMQGGGYYLIALAGGTNGTVLAPSADFTPASSIINMSGTTGKVALTNSTTALSPTPPAVTTSIVDLLGYGTANYYEGTAAAPAQTATGASTRGGSGCNDTDQNGADFTTVAPSPRNSQSAVSVCAGL